MRARRNVAHFADNMRKTWKMSTFCDPYGLAVGNGERNIRKPESLKQFSTRKTTADMSRHEPFPREPFLTSKPSQVNIKNLFPLDIETIKTRYLFGFSLRSMLCWYCRGKEDKLRIASPTNSQTAYWRIANYFVSCRCISFERKGVLKSNPEF